MGKFTDALGMILAPPKPGRLFPAFFEELMTPEQHERVMQYFERFRGTGKTMMNMPDDAVTGDDLPDPSGLDFSNLTAEQVADHVASRLDDETVQRLASEIREIGRRTAHERQAARDMLRAFARSGIAIALA